MRICTGTLTKTGVECQQWCDLMVYQGEQSFAPSFKNLVRNLVNIPCQHLSETMSTIFKAKEF